MVFQHAHQSQTDFHPPLRGLLPPRPGQHSPERPMSDVKTVSRSQLYESGGEDAASSDEQEYNCPPPGFDFEIVDVDDDVDADQPPAAEAGDAGDKTDDSTSLAKDGDDKVEYFPLFSTTATPNGASLTNSSGTAGSLVRIKVDDLADVDEEQEPGKVKDEEWDQIAKERNESRRPLSYYYHDGDGDDQVEKYKEVAVDGDTVIQWSKHFRILTNYRVKDLAKHNATVDLYHKIDRSARDGKGKKRGGKKQRDAKIFRKERLKEWKQKLAEARERARQRSYREDPAATAGATSSTKTKFGDSFRKRSNTVSKNIGRPGKPVFRTE